MSYSPRGGKRTHKLNVSTVDGLWPKDEVHGKTLVTLDIEEIATGIKSPPVVITLEEFYKINRSMLTAEGKNDMFKMPPDAKFVPNGYRPTEIYKAIDKTREISDVAEATARKRGLVPGGQGPKQDEAEQPPANVRA